MSVVIRPVSTWSDIVVAFLPGVRRGLPGDLMHRLYPRRERSNGATSERELPESVDSRPSISNEQ